ncbi:Similar to Tango1: Transport and Golgi organization protein 1 (Drosophila melanogaster) [Cotesia congregata]|uniref:Similar to Tango1: Transport and Golgi organization protein 1 (Drosophila melanogaster) n=1 Tax=Cotesia congregata TaxID=51543 RepID=A0A8J2MN02_COTCN|nr:Similar to Tango1: Transport and Golgi organization protein 1 (Drosophila melanogaster) [Cotesia congregata]
MWCSDIAVVNASNKKKNHNMIGKNLINISMERFLWISVIFIFYTISPCTSNISDKRLCYDPECSVPVSLAKTVMKYHSNDPQILSFEPNVDVTVFSKSAGSRDDLWGVEIAGRRGYAPVSFIREKKVLKKDLEHEVPTEVSNSSEFESQNGQKTQDSVINSNPEMKNSMDSISQVVENVSPSFEVIDGTTIDYRPDQRREADNFATRIIESADKEQPMLTQNIEKENDNQKVDNNMNDNSRELNEGFNDASRENNEKENEEADIPDNTFTQVLGKVSSLFDSFTTTESSDSKPQEIPPTGAPQNVENINPQSEQLAVTERMNHADSEVFQDSEHQPENQAQSDNFAGNQQAQVNSNNQENRGESNNFVENQNHQFNSENLSGNQDQHINSGNQVPFNSQNQENSPDTNNFSNNQENRGDSNNFSNNQQASFNSENSLGNQGNSGENKVSENQRNQLLNNFENNQSPIESENFSGSIDDSIDQTSSFNELQAPRSLLNVEDDPSSTDHSTEFTESPENNSEEFEPTTATYEEFITSTSPPEESQNIPEFTDSTADSESEDTANIEGLESEMSSDVCHVNGDCEQLENQNLSSEDSDEVYEIFSSFGTKNYWETLSYLALTAFTTLLFSLGYFYFENSRRDGQLIAKINKLEKELLVATKENTVLDDSLKSTKTRLDSIEDESFGSNEMVTSLKSELEAANETKMELENQIATLEKDLESATEAGLELERMLREILASNNQENPLAKSIEDLQSRLNAQQTINDSLKNALLLKTQEHDIGRAEIESLTAELAGTNKKYDQLVIDFTRVDEELKQVMKSKSDIEEKLTKKIQEIEKQLADVSAEKIVMNKQLKEKKMELKDLKQIVKSNSSNIDLSKLADVSRIKAEADMLKEERDELKAKLGDVEGAHQLLEEHMKMINEEVVSLSEQCKIAIKEKAEAETRLEVLTKFFNEKEAERQKEEAMWLQQQGEVSTTIDRLHMMQNEIHNYKQQIETLKHEILDQEKEYKKQIADLEAKSHENWVRARQNERRLEESKAEASQLRNRLTLIEKNFSDTDSDIKTHRMESNGETATSPQLFLAESSSSPIMFAGSSSMPPPPYLHGPLPPYMHGMPPLPGYDVGQRPPPLGGRLSSPPPVSGPLTGPPPPLPSSNTSNSRFNHASSSPPSPPISPGLPLPHPHSSLSGHYRPTQPPPPPPVPFPGDRIPPVPLPSMLPPPGAGNSSWSDEKLPSRNNGGSFHPFQRDQRDFSNKHLSSDKRQSSYDQHRDKYS